MDSSARETLEKVKDFAAEAHRDQMRKFVNEPYINHPVRVMELVRDYIEDLPVLSAALLHDVLEDTPITKRKLGQFLVGLMSKEDADKTLILVDELTDVYIKTDYPKLNRRTRKNKEAERLGNVSPEAQTVKYADIIDNVRDIANQDTDFALVYIRESKQLLQYMTKGNTLLYHRAIDEVDQSLRNFWDQANIKAL